jgi:anthranilate phosphoribosyltransferase
LESLGVNLDITCELVEKCIDEIDIGFLYAPALHGAMRFAIGPRKEIGIRTIFNIVGPLTNPAGADRQVLGVYHEDQVELLAHVLRELGCKHGFVVYGRDGMDEISLTTETVIAEVVPTGVEYRLVHPTDFGFAECRMEDLRGGDARQNASIVRDILSGQKGPKRDIVLLNAAFALVAVGKVADPADGLILAAGAIDSGLALRQLEKLIQMTNKDEANQ